MSIEQLNGGRVHQEVKAIIDRKISLNSHIATQFTLQIVGIYETLILIENGQTPPRQ